MNLFPNTSINIHRGTCLSNSINFSWDRNVAYGFHIVKIYHLLMLLHTHTHTHTHIYIWTLLAVLGDVSAVLVTPPCFNQIFYIGVAIYFRCVLPLSNPPMVNVSWYRVQDSRETRIRSSLWDRSVVSVDTFSISSLATSDTGSYFCSVSNEVIRRRDSNRIAVPFVESTYVKTTALNTKLSI